MELLGRKQLTLSDVQVNKVAFSNTQGYALLNHGREHVWLAFIRAKDRTKEGKAAFRAKIAAFGKRATNAYELYLDHHAYRQAKQDASVDPALASVASAIKERSLAKLLIAVGVSSSGYELLPAGTMPNEAAFAAGFDGRFPKASDSQPAKRYDALIVIASNDKRGKLGPAAETIRNTFVGSADIVWETGFVKPKNGMTRDFFGFRDGISQPVFFDTDWQPNGNNPKWNPTATLAYVLMRQPGDDHWEEYGSIMAFLKIRQDTAAFAKLTQQMADRCHTTPETVAAWMVGREPDGKPLVPHHGADPNDFTFAGDPNYHACPASAHIRKVNPRTDDVRIHRVLRRGLLYEEPGGEQGLLFQCFQSALREGFEKLLRDWALLDRHPIPNSGEDPLLGTRTCPPVPSGFAALQGADLQFEVRSVTQIRYGEYFYFPSIRFFDRLA